MSIRYLWITIRAINYTDRAFKAIAANVAALQKQEKNLASTAAVLKLSAGMMWIALGTMAVSGIMNMMRATQQGRTVMNAFDKSINQLTKSFATAFVKVLGPAIQGLTWLLNAISKLDPRILNVIAVLSLFAIGLGIVAGAMWVWQGLLGIIDLSFLKHILVLQLTNGANFSVVASTVGLSSALKGLKVSLGQALGIFTIFMSLGMLLGKEGSKWAAVIGIIALAVLALAHVLGYAAISMGVLTVGAAAAGGLAVAALMQNAMPSFQTGTRRAQFTGPAFVHAGERIGKEDQLKRELGGGKGMEKRQTNVAITFSGNIQTKADKEQLRPLILKTIKEALDNKV